ncbi:MAG: HD domain-containing phosphohydrolase [Porticoccaceae bacterium]
MPIDQIQIKAQDLALGMFVSGLDRPWSQTPFPLQGFYVRDDKDLAELRAYCSHVYIDVTKGRGPVAADGAAHAKGSAQSAPAEPTDPAARFGLRKDQPISLASHARPAPIGIRKGIYETTVPMRVEALQAERIVRTLKGQLTLATRQILKGRPLDYPALKRCVDDMVGSVLRCPDAFTWLLRLREKDRQSHDHSLRSALWAVQYARFVGMPKEEIATLCLGTLLKDIGKMRLPAGLLARPNRTEEEEQEYRRFVFHGVEMLRDAGNVEPKVIAVVRYHCERLDGSGFPEGVGGNNIPLLARIAGIATVYDAISNPRESAQPVAPSRAVSMLYNMRNSAFQEDLVVTFIQSAGLYPTGTLVELTTGDLGVVLDQHQSSRLTPRIAVLDRWGEDLNRGFIIIDLKDQEQSRRQLLQSGRDNVASVAKIAIARDLEPTGYDIDFAKLSATLLGAREEQVKSGLLATLKQRLRG